MIYKNIKQFSRINIIQKLACKFTHEVFIYNIYFCLQHLFMLKLKLNVIVT